MSNPSAVTAAINWFEIPVSDLDRAQRFYEILIGQSMRRVEMGPDQMAMFPYTDPATGGCLILNEHSQPSAQGTLVYLNGGEKMDDALARLEAAGGQLVTPRVELPDGMGCFVLFMDSEGNRLGLHALG